MDEREQVTKWFPIHPIALAKFRECGFLLEGTKLNFKVICQLCGDAGHIGLCRREAPPIVFDERPIDWDKKGSLG
jgi:hypothetical protein